MSETKRFFALTVKSIHKTTKDCVVIEFEVPTPLQDIFSFTQGQYLTLEADINGEKVRRSYSLCSSPFDKEWKVAVKQVPSGLFSSYANEVLKKGDILRVMPPDGRFFVPISEDSSRNYVCFAAGSGITPILSIIKAHLEAEPNAHFTLCYVNRSVSAIILKEEIEALKNIYMERLEIFYFLTKEYRNVPLFDGRLNIEKLQTLSESFINMEAVDHFFLCGPEEMIFMTKDFLTSTGIAADKIHFELFTASTSGQAKKTKDYSEVAGNLADITILDGGKSFTFSIDQGSQNILDAALANQADLPYACKGGVCCTCRAKLVEGKVDMLTNYALEEEEVEAGYILTCQSIPLSDKIVVDFDQ